MYLFKMIRWLILRLISIQQIFYLIVWLRTHEAKISNISILYHDLESMIENSEGAREMILIFKDIFIHTIECRRFCWKILMCQSRTTIIWIFHPKNIFTKAHTMSGIWLFISGHPCKANFMSSKRRFRLKSHNSFDQFYSKILLSNWTNLLSYRCSKLVW